MLPIGGQAAQANCESPRCGGLNSQHGFSVHRGVLKGRSATAGCHSPTFSLSMSRKGDHVSYKLLSIILILLPAELIEESLVLRAMVYLYFIRKGPYF